MPFLPLGGVSSDRDGVEENSNKHLLALHTSGYFQSVDGLLKMLFGVVLPPSSLPNPQTELTTRRVKEVYFTP